MILGKKTFQPVTSSVVYQIYELLHNEKLVSFPLTEEARRKVDSIVASITGSYFGAESYPSVEEKAVAYLYFLIKDHPFTDGNKRTASLTFSVVCELNNLVPIYKDFDLDVLAVYIEKIQEANHHKVIRTIAHSIFPRP